MSSLKNKILSNRINYSGWKTERKIVVIESDDWGAIRMPNIEVFKKAIDLGLPIKNNPYNRVDTLANQADLEALFSLLFKFKDIHGNHPVITMNTVMSNPDFEKISAHNFEQYFAEDFQSTVKRYYPNENVYDLWKQGMDSRLLKPQFHGNEHVNVPLWLKALQNEYEPLRKAFDLGFWCLEPDSYKNEIGLNLQATYDGVSKEAIPYHKKSLEEGLKSFQRVFGFPSLSFIPNNFVLDKKEMSNTLKENGVMALQGRHYHLNPKYIPYDDRILKRKTGRDGYGFFQIIRNCTFEPAQSKSTSGLVNQCLFEISNAFYWKKPAVLTAHRLNFIGAIDEKNRKENLRLLDELLTAVLKKFPDVTFMDSEELALLMIKSKA